MKLCPWCNTEYPDEFFEEHHKNHIHEDNSPENLIEICVKCHKRHHFESGYDTVILKKNDVKPRTLEDEMVVIDREEFLKVYRERQSGIFKDKWEQPKNWKKILSNGLEIMMIEKYSPELRKIIRLGQGIIVPKRIKKKVEFFTTHLNSIFFFLF